MIENTKSEDDGGGISIEIEGGTAEYSFLWTGPNEYTSQDQNLTNLSAGNYSLKVTDASGCEFFNEFLVEQDGDFNYGLSVVNILGVLAQKQEKSHQFLQGAAENHLLLSGTMNLMNSLQLNQK